jgi:polysaccharide biosynthesis/export protein
VQEVAFPLSEDGQVRVARALQLPAVMTGLVLSGCVQTAAPVATGQPRNDLDAMAYGQPYSTPNAAIPARSTLADSGGASFAASPRSAYAAAPAAYPAAQRPTAYDAPYRLDAGDRLRVVVFGQEGLTNTYAIDAGGSITMPLIGAVGARGRTPAGLAAEISAKLRNGFIREPSVAVEVETYRPFFILGEVAAPGQYPYVPNMTVESAVAIAGGFSPRAKRDSVTLTHTDSAASSRTVVPLPTPLSPGDTILVGERWF